MTQMVLAGVLGGAGASHVANIGDMEIVVSGTQAWLVTSSGAAGGLTTFALAAGSLGQLLDQQALPFDGATQTSTAMAIVGQASGYLAVNAGTNKFSGTVLDGTGQLGSVTGEGSKGSGDVDALTQLGTSGGGWLYSGNETELRWFKVGESNLASEGTLVLAEGAGISAMTTLTTADGQAWLVTASGSGDSFSSWRIDGATGAPMLVGTLGAAEGLGVNAPSAVASATIAGQSYIIGASCESGALSVMRLASSGALVATDHVIDTLDTRFDNVTALDVAQVGDRAFVLAGGGDDGISLFTLMPDGHLVWLENLVDTAGMTLANVAAIDSVVLGDTLQIFVASQSEPGVTQVNLPLSTLGVTLQAGPGGGPLTGGAGNDLLCGGAGVDSLQAGAGDDVLSDGPGQDMLSGGKGADVFVLSADGATDVITDFQAEVDRLDLSQWWLLHDPSQLAFTTTADGARITYGAETLEIHSSSGKALTSALVFPDGFNGPDRPPLILATEPVPPGTEDADRIEGGQWDDLIEARGGADTCFGGAGHDTLDGGAGDDSLEGGAGNDLICGGAGWDMLRAGDGNDTAEAGDGRDRVFLGSGHDLFIDSNQSGPTGSDTVWGMDGNDRLLARGGDDWLHGGAGEDRLEGGEGADRLWGDDGWDTLIGGAGDDSAWGGNGRDLARLGDGNDRFQDNVQGGIAGSDTIYGGNGNDTILARGGDDVAWGEAGDDVLEGGVGNDQLHGGSGRDVIRGLDGDDEVWGDEGRDMVLLGQGDDVFHDCAQAGADGNDTVWGYTGRDTILGGGGNDQFHGEADDDWLEGGSGQDGLWGDAGNDVLAGGAGNDLLHGGLGADTFVFRSGDGADRIFDFTPGEDMLRLEAGLGYADLTFQHDDAGLHVGFADVSILLSGFGEASLSIDAIQFG